MLHVFLGIEGNLRSLVANQSNEDNASEPKRGFIEDLNGKHPTIGLVQGLLKILADKTFYQFPHCCKIDPLDMLPFPTSHERVPQSIL